MDNKDLTLWKAYKKSPNPSTRSALLDNLQGILRAQVNRWTGPVPYDVLMNKAKLLAAKAFDTYNPSMGSSLATYVTNALLPISRIVYTYQNAARIPENLTMKITSYVNTVNDFKTVYGRDPTTDELHDRLGWKSSELTRIRDYNIRDLVESGQEVSGRFYEKGMEKDVDDTILGGIYMNLAPQDKTLFEYTTGYNGAPILPIAEISKRMGLSAAQVAYRKQQMRKQIDNFMKRPSLQRVYGK